MTVRCIFGARFTMSAEILRPDASPNVDPEDPGSGGTWTTNQDPISGQIVNVWVPGQVDDPNTIDINESAAHIIVPCMIRGFLNSGIRTAPSDERFGQEYINMEYIRMWIPAGVILTKRDRVTNIKDPQGNIVFYDEEYEADPTRVTVFNVQGVTPRFDPFNRLMDQFILLEKTQ